MKKLISLILACVMVLSLAACGAKTEEPAQPAVSTNAEEPVKTEEPLNWPDGDPINVLIPTNTGGDTDTVFRTLSAEIGEKLGTEVMLTNMYGGAGAVACNELLDYDADGYTGIWYHFDTVLLTMKGEMEQRYDEYLDFSVVIPVTGGEYVMTVNKNSGFETLEEFVAYAKEHPGELVCATESGGWNQVFGTAICQELGIELNFVDLGSTTERIAALLGGNADVIFGFYKNFAGYPDDLNVLVSFSEERQSVCPDVPTLGECGYAPLVSDKFYYFAFKDGTDPRIVDAMTEAIKHAVASDAGVEVLKSYNYTSWDVLTGEDALAHLHAFEEKYQPSVDAMLANAK